MRVFQSALFRFDANVVTWIGARLRRDLCARRRCGYPEVNLGEYAPISTVLRRGISSGHDEKLHGRSGIHGHFKLINQSRFGLIRQKSLDGYDVWEILSRLTLNGAKLEVIPRAMFWTGSVMKGTKYTKDDRAGRFATEN